MGEAVGEIYCDFGNGDLDDQGYQAEKVRELERTVNSLKLELRTNQGGTRVWRIRAFAALCVITILPLAVIAIVTLVKEEALEESGEQLAKDMNQKFEKMEKQMISKENLTVQLDQLKENMKAEMIMITEKLAKKEKRSAHCGYHYSWSSTGQIWYDKLITDDGDSNLDRSSGLWTAGCAGVYQVSWSVQMSVRRYETNRIYLYRNGIRVAESYHNAYNGDSDSSSSYTDEVGGRTMLLSLKKGSTLALRLDTYQETIYHIVFCVNLLYVNDNARISITRMTSYGPENGTINNGYIEESSGSSDK